MQNMKHAIEDYMERTAELSGAPGESGEETTRRTGNPYLDTVDRMEPDIACMDAGAFYASASVSLKHLADAHEEFAGAQTMQLVRIADSLETIARAVSMVEAIGKSVAAQPGAISPMAIIGALMK